MSRASGMSARSDPSKRRSLRVHAILTRHFGFRSNEVEHYLAGAAKRERRKVIEIENAVVRIAHDFS